jgi:hypothetical protein
MGSACSSTKKVQQDVSSPGEPNASNASNPPNIQLRRKSIDKKQAATFDEEAKARRSTQGKLENMVHEEFTRGNFLLNLLIAC